MAKVYNSPPNWPRPPEGWMPEPGWRPDPGWGPAPDGWQFWIEDAPAVVPPVAFAQPAMPSSAAAHELRIFLSYRRTDCQPQANGLYDGLRRRLPDARVFLDIDGIPAATNFEEHIRREISVCDIVLVMIGDNWLDARPGSEVRRIDESGDFVRLEVENALAHSQVDVLPVLVEDAVMPSPADMPDSIVRLAALQGVELSDRRWPRDLDHLVAEVEKIAVRRGKGTTTVPPVLAGHGAVAAREPRTAPIAFLLMLVPFLTFGFGAWVPSLWASLRRPPGDPMRTRLFLVTGVIAMAAVVGFSLIGTGPKDANGHFTGPQTGIGVMLWLGAMIAGTTLAVVLRKPPPRRS